MVVKEVTLYASESEDSESEGEEEIAALGAIPEEAKRRAIYKTDGMHECLEEFMWTDGAPWSETLIVTSEEPTEIPDVHDDLNRELAFYNQV
eukprot:615882-Pyramimonas_sp.AAC.3